MQRRCRERGLSVLGRASPRPEKEMSQVGQGTQNESSEQEVKKWEMSAHTGP